MDKDFSEILEHYNEAAKKLVDWARSKLDTPFMETENGQTILKTIGDIASASGLLNLEAINLLMEDLIIAMKTDSDE